MDQLTTLTVNTKKWDLHCAERHWFSTLVWAFSAGVQSEAAEKTLTVSLCVSLLPSSHILWISPITWTSNLKKNKKSLTLFSVLSVLLPGQQRPSCRAPSVLGTHHRPVINVEWQSESEGRAGEAEKEAERVRGRGERETEGWRGRLTKMIHRSSVQVKWPDLR